ncbi:MAG: phosphate acyltransferase PlsX [Eubacteriales bacterium]|nr:phosphate acyltransferase PlsX [Eubacteriales bacterium]
MSELTRIVVDAMGGDYAPAEPVKGAVDALAESDRIKVILTGDAAAIEKELEKYSYPAERLEIVPTTQVIETGEPPVKAIQSKRDSSLVVGLNLVHKGEADAFVSSGSTGAVLVGGQGIVKKIRGIQRAPLAPLIPTAKGVSLLIDCGANVDARPSHLVQFAVLGSIYMKSIMGIENPRVGLVNIGTEEEKGNALCKETFPLLQACPDINFIGNVEARDISAGAADVYVTEAFVGNVILKMYEGVGKTLLHAIKDALMSSTRSKVGALLIKPALKSTLKKFDSSSYGGAPLLGLKGLVVKTHGSSKANEFRNTILQCIQFKEEDVNGKIQEFLAKQSAEKEAAADKE